MMLGAKEDFSHPSLDQALRQTVRDVVGSMAVKYDDGAADRLNNGDWTAVFVDDPKVNA
jgi:hypothetical protein